MRPAAVASLLLAFLACRPDPAAEPHPGDAALLAGTWELVAHRADHPDILGRITLAPSAPDDPDVPPGLKGGTLEGSFQLRETGWLAQLPTDSGSTGYLDADSSVVLYLRLAGRCTNCGNLGFAGHLAGDSVVGHWTQEFGSPPPEGSFVLQRSGSP
jgi:hypothetical protein